MLPIPKYSVSGFTWRPTSLVIMGTQIKTTLQHHVPPDKLAEVKKSDNIKCWERSASAECTYTQDCKTNKQQDENSD